jgi:hypothetical protein
MRIGAVITLVGADDVRSAVTALRTAQTRPGPAAGHPVTHQRNRRHLRAPRGACHRASAIEAALGRGCRQLTPALLGVG